MSGRQSVTQGGREVDEAHRERNLERSTVTTDCRVLANNQNLSCQSSSHFLIPFPPGFLPRNTFSQLFPTRGTPE